MSYSIDKLKTSNESNSTKTTEYKREADLRNKCVQPDCQTEPVQCASCRMSCQCFCARFRIGSEVCPCSRNSAVTNCQILIG